MRGEHAFVTAHLPEGLSICRGCARKLVRAWRKCWRLFQGRLADSSASAPRVAQSRSRSGTRRLLMRSSARATGVGRRGIRVAVPVSIRGGSI